MDDAEGDVRTRVGVAGLEEEREPAEGTGDGAVVRGVGGHLEDSERVGLTGGVHGLGGEEDVSDGEELVGAGEERICLHRALGEALAADEVARGEKLRRNLQPSLRLRPTAGASAAPTPTGAGRIVHGFGGNVLPFALPLWVIWRGLYGLESGLPKRSSDSRKRTHLQKHLLVSFVSEDVRHQSYNISKLLFRILQ